MPSKKTLKKRRNRRNRAERKARAERIAERHRSPLDQAEAEREYRESFYAETYEQRADRLAAGVALIDGEHVGTRSHACRPRRRNAIATADSKNLGFGGEFNVDGHTQDQFLSHSTAFLMGVEPMVNDDGAEMTIHDIVGSSPRKMETVRVVRDKDGSIKRKGGKIVTRTTDSFVQTSTHISGQVDHGTQSNSCHPEGTYDRSGNFSGLAVPGLIGSRNKAMIPKPKN